MIEIIPQEQKGLFAGRLPLVLGVALCVVFAGAFGILLQLQGGSKKSIASLQNFLSTGATSSEKSLEQKVLTYQKKISDFGIFAQNRVDSLFVFQFLEQYTLPKVSFTSISVDVPNRHVVLQGESADFTTLKQQLLLFRQRTEVTSVALSNMNLGINGRIVFALDMTFK